MPATFSFIIYIYVFIYIIYIAVYFLYPYTPFIHTHTDIMNSSYAADMTSSINVGLMLFKPLWHAGVTLNQH